MSSVYFWQLLGIKGKVRSFNRWFENRKTSVHEKVDLGELQHILMNSFVQWFGACGNRLCRRHLKNISTAASITLAVFCIACRINF